MPRRRPPESDVHHERWLISYADFITLLFAFFVVMYSISQVNESKYRVLSETLNVAFNETIPMTLDPVQVGDPQLRAIPSVIQGGGQHEADHTTTGDGAFDKTADLPQLSDMFEDEFSDLIDDKLIQVHSNELWLEVELKSSILFDSADAEPSLQAESIFADIAGILKGFNNPIQVEGFTDNVPIRNRQFPSNWELSGARASSVVKLLARGGVKAERLSAVGFGEFQPIADNTTDSGRAENRRVVLMIARERLQRPNVRTQEDIGQAVEPAQKEVLQPYPQPSDAEPEPALVPTPTVEGGEPATQTDVEPPSDAAEAETTEQERLAPVGEIKPIELEGGGLLFSSDPDLPRN